MSKTDAENLLWSKLRRKQLKGYQFYQQKTIGKYIGDFYCPKVHLAIELDSGQHCKDGVKTLRFSEREVFENINGVIEGIWNHYMNYMICKASPNPSFSKRGVEDRHLPRRVTRNYPQRCLKNLFSAGRIYFLSLKTNC